MKFEQPHDDGARHADRTRDAVARTVLERGPQTAAALADSFGLSAAAIRRHLDALVTDGVLAERDRRPAPGRGRGRPARVYELTERGRADFPHDCDDLAGTALRYLQAAGGDAAVTAFAEHRAAALADQLRASMDGAQAAADAPLTTRTHAMAQALSSHGYASTTQAVPGADGQPLGVQVCQHHCPVAHVAAEFPQLCEAETRAFERVLGTYAQRLATIAHGDGVCTTHVPLRPPTDWRSADPVRPTKTAPARSGRNQI